MFVYARVTLITSPDQTSLLDKPDGFGPIILLVFYKQQYIIANLWK